MLKHSRKKKHVHPFWKITGMLMFFMFSLGVLLLSGFLVWAATIDLPDFNLFEQRKVSQSTKIYDRTGKILLYDVHKDVRRTIVPFEGMSLYIKNATVAIEDDEFYSHFGVRPKAFLRAVLANARSGEYSQGGSTITQQVIKMSLLTKEKTISRKLKEWILAIRLERTMNKEQILALYLNEAPYGGNIYGVEEASLAFFGKQAKDVTLAEAAYLAALPQAPTTYSPYGENTNKLESRKNQVLKKMLALNSITQDEYNNAMSEKVKFLPLSERGIKAPHFVMFVKQVLAEKYGDDLLNEGGLTVVTSLNMNLQEKAEQIVKTYAEKNEKEFNAHNEALVAIDPKSGEILTMVGSRDYFDTENEGNFNIALAKRQPGSSFKPFVYAASFEKGYTPDTVLFDLPTEFSTHCDALGKPIGSASADSCYMPGNYDNSFRGPISLRNALAQSINVPAVKLLYLVGIDDALNMAKRLGISTLLNKERYGLTLVLGGGEVTLLEMTSAYGVFANDGVRVPYQAILKVTTNDNVTLEEFTPKGEQVIDQDVARKISDVLSDNSARTPAYGSQSYLHFPDHQVAVKTGTTNDYRDTWIVGYTPNLAVGAWAGNNDNTPMEKKVAGFIIAPMWNAFMKEVFNEFPDSTFNKPLPTPSTLKPALRGVWYGNTTYIIDKYSGKLATQFTPNEAKEERVIPDAHEILHWVDKDNPTGAAPNQPSNDPQYWLWEIPVRAWININGLPKNAVSNIPTGYDDIHTEDQRPILTFTNSTTSLTCIKGDKVFVQVEIQAKHGIKNVDLFLNETFISSVNTPPYLFSFVPTNETPTLSSVKVVAHDLIENTSSISQTMECKEGVEIN